MENFTFLEHKHHKDLIPGEITEGQLDVKSASLYQNNRTIFISWQVWPYHQSESAKLMCFSCHAFPESGTIKSVASWPEYPAGEVGFHARVFGKLHFELGGHQNLSESMHDSS